MANYTQPRDPTTGRYVSAGGGSSGGGGFNLGTAHGKVVISTNVAEAMAQAKQSFTSGIQNLGSSMQSWGSSMQSTGGAITTLTSPLALFGATGLKTAMDFDSAMTMIGARTGLTGDALDAIKDKALDLGAKTAFSSQQAADAFLNLLTAGLSVEDSMSAIDHVMTAAAASGEGLSLTADNLTGVMAAFGLKASEAGRIVEAMSRAGSASKATMADMGFALQDVGGIAKSYGISLEDTSAILAIFAGQNIKGTEAGTQLRSMLLAMDAPTKRATETWAELGISMYDAQGNSRRMADVMRDLQVALRDKSDEEKNRIVKALAGSYGLVGFTALAAGEGIDAMRAKMDAQQSAADVAARNTDTFAFTLESLGGSIETLQQTSLIPFMNETLKPLVTQLIETINGVTDWVKANPELTQTIVKVGAALVVLGPLLVGAGIVLSSLGTVVVALGGALSALLSPIGLLAAAFITDFGGVRTAVMPILDNLFNGFNQIRNAIGWIWSDLQHFGIGSIIEALFGGSDSSFGSRYEMMFTNILMGFGMSRDSAIDTAGSIMDTLGRFGDAIRSVVDTLRPLFTEIGTFIGNLFANIDLGQILQIGSTLLSLTNPIGLLKTGLQLLGVDFGQVFRDAVDMATRFFNALNNGAGIFDALRAAFGDSTFIDGLETGLNNVIAFITGTVIPGLQTLADWFTITAMPAVISFIETIIVPGIQNFVDILIKIWNDVSPFLYQLFSWFTLTAMPIIIGFIQTFVIPVIQGMIDLLVGIWDAISPTLTMLYDWFITTGLPFIVDFITGPFSNAINGIKDFLVGLWTAVQPHLESFKNGMKSVMDWIRTNVIQPFLDTVTAIISKIRELLGMDATQIGKTHDSMSFDSFAAKVSAAKQGVQATGSASLLPTRDSGGSGKKGMSYLIGKGAQPEMFIPETNGTFVPNADKLGGDTYNIGDVIVQGANSYKEGREAGNGALDAINERMRSQGLKLRT